ncbi:MAG: hypothetical protein Q4F66_03380 [Clostridium sp.]|nr:hypothetical protein [Clostridium sp.]
MAIRKFRSEDRENDLEYRSLEIESSMYSYFKCAVLILAAINFDNTNVWAGLMIITSAFSAVEIVKKNKFEKSIKNKKFNKLIIILNCVVFALCLINLFLYNVIK